MPNWATNILTVEGDEDEVKKFIHSVLVTTPDNDIDEEECEYSILSRLLPCPKDLTDTVATNASATPNPRWAEWLASGELTQMQYDEMVKSNEQQYAQQQANYAKYGFRDWYDWQVVNWGTKWGDSDTCITARGDGWVIFRFDTPWGPPIAGIAKIAETLYPDLTFILSYKEEGMAYAGCTGFRNDMVFSEDVDNVPFDLVEDENGDYDYDMLYEQYEEVMDTCEKAVREILAGV